MISPGIKVYSEEDDKRIRRICEEYRVELLEGDDIGDTPVVYLCGDKTAVGATPYYEYDWPEEAILWLGEDYAPLHVAKGAPRITIPTPVGMSMFACQAIAIILEYLHSGNS